jgi:hypothetical protein
VRHLKALTGFANGWSAAALAVALLWSGAI